MLHDLASKHQARPRKSAKKTFVILDVATCDRQIVPDFSAQPEVRAAASPVCRFTVVLPVTSASSQSSARS